VWAVVAVEVPSRRAQVPESAAALIAVRGFRRWVCAKRPTTHGRWASTTLSTTKSSVKDSVRRVPELQYAPKTTTAQGSSHSNSASSLRNPASSLRGFMCPPGAEVVPVVVAVFLVVVAVVVVVAGLEVVLEEVVPGCSRPMPDSSSTRGAVSKPGISRRWCRRDPPRTWADLPRHPTTGHTSTDPPPQP
jgi:hypothetical protein